MLCKTSNPGSADIQDLFVRDPTEVSIPWRASGLYEHVAELANTLNQNDNLGLVVGATHPEALARVREVAPELWILAPGVGAQGGDAATVVAHGLDANGRGLLINSSRGIIFADDPAVEARALRDQIRDAVATRGAA